MRANTFGEAIRSPNEARVTDLGSSETMWELDERFGSYEMVFRAAISGESAAVDNAFDICMEAKSLFYH